MDKWIVIKNNYLSQLVKSGDMPMYLSSSTDVVKSYDDVNGAKSIGNYYDASTNTFKEGVYANWEGNSILETSAILTGNVDVSGSLTNGDITNFSTSSLILDNCSVTDLDYNTDNNTFNFTLVPAIEENSPWTPNMTLPLTVEIDTSKHTSFEGQSNINLKYEGRFSSGSL